jgi:hypothetical protein
MLGLIQMIDLDVDEIMEVNYPEESNPAGATKVQVVFKNGTTKVYEGPDLPEVLAILNHWTPPTA